MISIVSHFRIEDLAGEVGLAFKYLLASLSSFRPCALAGDSGIGANWMGLVFTSHFSAISGTITLFMP